MIRMLCHSQKSCKTSTDKKNHVRKMKKHLRTGNFNRLQIKHALEGRNAWKRSFWTYCTKLQHHPTFITVFYKNTGP